MAKRHSATMEAGGWALLIAAIIAILYLLFHEKGQAALTGGTVVSSTLGGKSTGPPTITLDDPTMPHQWVADDGTVWEWSPDGKQWYITGQIV